MSAFISGIVKAAPLVELLQHAVGVSIDDAFETVYDNTTYGVVSMEYDVGPYGIEIWASQMLNAKPEFLAFSVGVSFGFCPDSYDGWTNALVSFQTTIGNSHWELKLEIEEVKQSGGANDPQLPEDVRLWYLDSAKTLIVDLGFDVDLALRKDGIRLGDTIEVLPLIRRASNIFAARGKTAPFDIEKIKNL